MTIVVVGGLGIVGWLFAGAFVVAALFVTPEAGERAAVVALQGFLVVGWLVGLVWLVWDTIKGRFRLVAALIATWIWVAAFVLLIADRSFMGIGP